jgi:hypothetical protein
MPPQNPSSKGIEYFLMKSYSLDINVIELHKSNILNYSQGVAGGEGENCAAATATQPKGAQNEYFKWGKNYIHKKETQ